MTALADPSRSSFYVMYGRTAMIIVINERRDATHIAFAIYIRTKLYQ